MSGHILLADDSHSVHRQARNILDEESIPLVCVSNGDDALNHALADPPLLVLADLTMPRMGGLELCRRLGLEVQTRTIPVVLLVSPFDEFDERTEEQSGAQGHLMKPLESDALLEIIANIARKSPSSSTDEAATMTAIKNGSKREGDKTKAQEEQQPIDDASDLPEPDGLSERSLGISSPSNLAPSEISRDDDLEALPEDAVLGEVDALPSITAVNAPTVIEVASEEVDVWTPPEDEEQRRSKPEDPDRAELESVLDDVAEHGTLPALVRSIVQKELNRMLPRAIEAALRAQGLLPVPDDSSPPNVAASPEGD